MKRRLRYALSVLLVCAPLAAQTPTPGTTEPPRHGSLTVWYVAPASPTPAAQPYTQYHEQTAGSFGAPASTVGHAASEVGVTSDSFPATATIGSKPASEVGQTAGSFGTPSSNIGQTAGSYGQSASTLGTPAAPEGQPALTQPTITWISASSPQLDRTWLVAFAALHRVFAQPAPRVAFVTLDDLPDRLHAAQGTRDYPDVLVGTPLLQRANQPFLRDETLTPLGPPLWTPDALGGRTLPEPAEALILVHAPHPVEARAFIVALSDLAAGVTVEPRFIPAAAREPASMAISAAQALIAGAGPGAAADPSLAQVNPALARAMIVWLSPATPLQSQSVRTDVLTAVANERFAIVALRTIAESANAFGVFHPFVVLRTSPDRQWRVLQVSADLRGEVFARTVSSLRSYAQHVAPDHVRPVAAIKQAAPVDDDVRTGPVDLWWDNPGSGSMLVLEWQRAGQGGWADSHLYPVPDSGSHLQVRVTAPFAPGAGLYRWRVWTLGTGGTTAISPWRRLTLQP